MLFGVAERDIAALLPQNLKEQLSGDAVAAELIPADLTENERKVWELLAADDATHIDVLLESSRLSFGDLNNSLVA